MHRGRHTVNAITNRGTMSLPATHHIHWGVIIGEATVAM
jgi:hypothetical protein